MQIKKQKRTKKIFLRSITILTEIQGTIVSLKTGWYEEKRNNQRTRESF